MRFSVNFSHEKVLLWNLLEFVGDGTDIHRQSQVRNGVLVYIIVQNTKVTHTQ